MIPKEYLKLEKASPDQQEAFSIIQDGHHCLITGQGGTGKSWLIEQIINKLDKTVLTASTGIAGVNIGGRTIHSWSGLGMAQETVEELMQKFITRSWLQPARDRIQWPKRLIIDEVSMLGVEFMEKLDQVMRLVRKNQAPFGGCQLVMFGDFLQLPPVKARPFFTSPLWAQILPSVKVLTTVHRQKDKKFAELLQRVRLAEHTPDDVMFLKALENTEIPEGAVILHSHNVKVDAANVGKLKSLTTELFTYIAKDSGTDETALKQLQKDCLSPTELYLKVGARVMMTKNDGESSFLCNGSTGTVTKLSRESVRVLWDGQTSDTGMLPMEWEITDPATREPVAKRRQFPLKLAWAITIHKAQGLTLDSANLFLRDCFMPGQVYVALSRMSTDKHLKLSGFNPSKIKADRFALAFYDDPSDPTFWGYSGPEIMNTDPLFDF